jgi:hypothetical protein
LVLLHVFSIRIGQNGCEIIIQTKFQLRTVYRLPAPASLLLRNSRIRQPLI